MAYGYLLTGYVFPAGMFSLQSVMDTKNWLIKLLFSTDWFYKDYKSIVSILVLLNK